MNARFKLVLVALTVAWFMTQWARDCDAAEVLAMAGLAVGNNADGRLEVFHVGRDGELHHRWQRESTHDWTSWTSLGGAFSPGAAVANDPTGRLDVFVVERDTKIVKYKCQMEPNSPAWSNWVALPGQRVEGPVAVCAGSRGRLEVFAAGAEDQAVKHAWQTDDAGNWSRWTDMDAVLEPGLQVVRDHIGRLEVFGIQTRDGSLIHSWQTMPDEPRDWSSWVGLGERIAPGFSVGQNGDGRLEVFGVNPGDGEVVHAFQLSSVPESAWSPWLGLGAKMKPGITLGRNNDNRLELFAVNPKNDLVYGAFQIKANATTNWTDWGEMSLMGRLYPRDRHSNVAPDKPPLADMGASAQSSPVIGKNKSGGLELFAFDARDTNVLKHRSQIAGDLHWTDWFSLDRATTQYGLRAWRIDEGLPDNRVQAIAQTPDGYIWVGTRNGLARFDGVHFEPVDLPGALRMTNLSVTALLVGENGALWIGLNGGGVVRIFGGEISHYGKTNGLAGDHIITMYEDRGKSLWIGTTGGLSHYEGGKFVNYTNKDELGAIAVQSVLEDSASNVWVAADNKLTCINGKTFTRFTKARDLGHIVRCIWLDTPGRLWIGSDRGLVLYRSYNTFYAYDKHFGLSGRIVNVIRGDSHGNLWVGTDTGLTRFEEGRFVEDIENEGASFGKINSLFEDREGDLWVGSQNGLFRLTPRRLLSLDRRRGLTQNHVTAVMESDAGNFWVGTAGGGLNELKDGSFAAYASATNFALDWITSLCNGRDGSLWIGGDYDSGLGQIKEGRLTRHTSKDGLPRGTVKVIHEDHSGCLWIGTSGGLSCLRDGKFTTYTVRDKLAGNVVRDICEDHEGHLWIGTEGGLSLWKGGQFTNFTTGNGLSDNVVTALYSDSDDSLWIGTDNGGLNRFHDGRFTAYTAEQGLFSNEILAIAEDDFGWLWMTCSKGVFRVSKSSLNNLDSRRSKNATSIVYGHDDGMESVLCSDGKPGCWKTRDGRLWFPTSLGLVVMDPRAMSVNHMPPPVYIEQMIVNGRSVLHRDNAFLTEAPVAPVQIPPGRNELEFRYTALHFERPERIRFRYRLEGADPDWIEAGTRRAAYYNNLPPGNYSFHVIACNSDGAWNETGATLAVILPPHLWQMWWFLALCGLGTVTAIVGVVRYTTKRKMEKSLQQMQQRHAVELERTRIARDMHDELGAKLTSISFQGAMARNRLHDTIEAAQHVDKMAQTARELVCSLDEIVWAVDPKNDSLEDLATYVCRYASGFFEDSPVHCIFRIPDRLPDCRLTSDVRHNLFLAIKEALNNILKHSEATTAEVQIIVRDKTFEIRISDNGLGIAQPGPIMSGRVGHGLANLHERLAAIQGRCEVTATLGQGTAILLVVPLTTTLAV